MVNTNWYTPEPATVLNPNWVRLALSKGVPSPSVATLPVTVRVSVPDGGLTIRLPLLSISALIRKLPPKAWDESVIGLVIVAIGAEFEIVHTGEKHGLTGSVKLAASPSRIRSC